MGRTPPIEELVRMLEIVDSDLNDPELGAEDRDFLQTYMDHLEEDYRTRTGEDYI